MDVSKFKYNPTLEKIVDILMVKTQNYDPHFFRLQTNFFLSLVPSVMNIKIDSPITGTIPINFYGVSLANSGTGKGYSTNLLEARVLKQFKSQFMFDVFPKRSELSLELEAMSRSNSSGISQNDALDNLKKEFKSYGAYKFSFDSATAPAIKQLRNKLLLAHCGALNVIIDEIGLNLQANSDALTALLELYDKGIIRDKLTKNTEASLRYQELTGSTPANMLLFGSPSKLLNGGTVENDFFEFLETGYARRCFFNFSKRKQGEMQLTAEEQYDLLTQTNQEQDLDTIATHLARLADTSFVGTKLTVPKDVGIKLIAYRQFCERRAEMLPEFAEIQKSELTHRYFKALKLAGVYAFIDGSLDINEDYLEQAIKFAEDSGEAITQLFHREKPYERLARYIADCSGTELTQVDLAENLPCYKGSASIKTNLMNMAIAWGYKNNIIIKRRFKDNVEFISGDSLPEFDPNKIICAYSQHFADDYVNAGGLMGMQVAPISWDNFDQLVTADGYHWTNHYTKNGHRSGADMVEGFNVIVLDIDHKTNIDTVQKLLSDYEYLIHTTKRHQQVDPVTGQIGEDRFRVILPMNFELKLNNEDYKEFMKNLAEWLPFDGLDEATFQPSRKWASCANAEVYRNSGELIDVTSFIPKTTRNEEYKRVQLSMQSLTNIERWFAMRMQEGNRNNMFANYGFMLLDAGMSINDIGNALINLNSKIENPLEDHELLTTVMTSIKNRAIGA